MKTNIILESQSRNLFGQIVRQQTKDGMLNLSDLQEAYTVARVKNGWPEKNINRIMENDKETLFYLLEKQQVIDVQMSTFINNVDNQGFAKYMKTLGVYKTTGARETRTVWVNPYIWVMVAMELNPIFKAEVIGWLTDSLIINRIEAGNFYKELSRAISKFSNVDYVRVAKGLNYCIFGEHETGLRNTATKEQLKELERLESRLAFAIDMDYIKTFDELIIELQKVYKLNN
jgi:hypothetical protein